MSRLIKQQIELAFIAGPAGEPELNVVLAGECDANERTLKFKLTRKAALRWATELIERASHDPKAADG